MIKGVRGPRSLLRQIREAMASGGPAQTRLDMTVSIIARSMVAEVCSIYLRRASGELELFATEGLNPEAVHATRLDLTVSIIARSMVAEVCSIYLRRASGELELFATEGLNPEAVHATRLN